MVSIAPAMETVNVATPSHGLIELPVVIAMRNRYFSSERLQVQKIQIEPGIRAKALLAVRSITISPGKPPCAEQRADYP